MAHSHQRWTDLAGPSNEQGSFVGFSIKSILFGIVILQAFQYFREYKDDTRRRKLMIVFVCLLELVHYITSARMMYASLNTHSFDSEQYVVWCIKILTTVKTLITLLVQSFYLHLIWALSKNLCMKQYLTWTIRSFSAIVFLSTIGISGAFLAYLEQASTMFNFSAPFLHVTSISVGSAAAIDCFIAIMMAVVLYKTGSRQPEQRGTAVVNHLILFFVLSGLVNAIPKIMIIVLYASNPSSILYLAAQFSIPSLCANSILTLFNAKSRLRGRMDNVSTELKISSALLFGDPVLEEDHEAEMSNSGRHHSALPKETTHSECGQMAPESNSSLKCA